MSVWGSGPLAGLPTLFCWTHNRPEPCEPCQRATVHACGEIVKTWKESHGSAGRSLPRGVPPAPEPTEPVQGELGL